MQNYFATQPLCPLTAVVASELLLLDDQRGLNKMTETGSMLGFAIIYQINGLNQNKITLRPSH